MSKRMDGTPHRIVIVGGGAGGLELATRLGRKFGRDGKAEITLIDSKRTHIWKPKLHEIAAGSMDFGDHEVGYLAHAHRHGFRFRIGEMTGIDRIRREVQVAPFADRKGREVTPARSFPYDTLVIAVGCTGGRHRSVYIAEQLQERFRALGGEVLCFHRELA